MGLLDNYVAAVKRHLPLRMREDVGDELHSTLVDSIDALEEATGRPLDQNEVAELIKRRGHPLLVASAYRGDRGLVGAQLFPIYLRVLKVGLVIAAIGVLADYVVGDGVVQARDLARLVHRYYLPALNVFAWVTIAFYLMDAWMARTQFLQRWNPLSLPGALDVQRWQAPRTFSALVHIGALVLVVKFVIHGAFLQGRLIGAPVPVMVELAPDFRQVFPWLVTALTSGIIVLTVWAVARGYWDRLTLCLSAVTRIALGSVLFWIAGRGEAFTTQLFTDSVPVDVDAIVVGLRIFLTVVATVSMHAGVRHLMWLVQPEPKAP
ncbi:hypothetical protein ACIGHF_00030 [Stenotrophomonas sp. NPDC077464]|uniref:hypothetical protein n=1 Tax=unclassified Stenotrophomonas TaxID=196198 RepID=UPI0037D738F4